MADEWRYDPKPNEQDGNKPHIKCNKRDTEYAQTKREEANVSGYGYGWEEISKSRGPCTQHSHPTI